jgi:hypothetical protein
MLNKILLLLLLLSAYSFSQTDNQIERIVDNYEFEKLFKLEEKFSKKFKKDYHYALELAKINGWPITKVENGNFMQLRRISSEGKPIYYSTYNLAAGQSNRTNFLYSGGGLGLNIEGQTMNAFVWDGGIARTSHQEFMVDGASKITVADGSTSISDHATHVMGTMIAQGYNNNAKGMAFQANGYSLDWNNDIAEATSAVGFGMLVSNHSYGIQNLQSAPDWYYGSYSSDSRAWDQLMYNAPYYLLCSAAGNDGQGIPQAPLDGNNSFDKLTDMSTSKNTLVVANAYDAIINSTNGVILGGGSIHQSSSQGPTDDYRIKPDITGNGYNLYSPTGSNNSSYNYFTGTSMASPSVAGTLLLIQQLANQERGSFLLSSSLKGLVLHTADDRGLFGPDAIYGWGYLNAKRSAELILSTTSLILEKSLDNNDSYSFEVQTDGSEPLEISLSWTDPPGQVSTILNDNTPVLVNDLDIRVTKDNIVYYPWKLTGVNSNTKGDNLVDPYEKVKIDNPAPGTYNVTISHKGSLFQNHQDYSLIVSGIVSSTASLSTNSLNDFVIFPNPTSQNDVTLSLTDGLVNGIFYITDIFGKTLVTGGLTSQRIQKINLTNLNKGIYFLTINKDIVKFTKKLIIK